MDKALVEKALQLINEFFVREFGEGSEVDRFEDLAKIPIAYTTTEDELTEIQVFGDLVNFRLDTYLGETMVRREQYSSLQEMVDDVLPHMEFDELTAISDEEILELDRRLTDAFNRSVENGEVDLSWPPKEPEK